MERAQVPVEEVVVKVAKVEVQEVAGQGHQRKESERMQAQIHRHNEAKVDEEEGAVPVVVVVGVVKLQYQAKLE